jgi:long-chain fatty acid transport protein
MRLLTSAFFLCTGAGVASANGFVLNDFSAKATGRGDATIATSADGTSIVYNVAGLAAQRGTNFYIGGSIIKASATFVDATDGGRTDTDSPVGITPSIHVTTRLMDKVVVGVGVHTPFGSKLVWPASSPSADEIREQQLRALFITPSFGIDLNKQIPGLQLGAGLDLVPADVTLKQDIFFGEARGNVTLGGNAFGIGGRVGAMYHPPSAPAWSFGATWKSEVKLDFEGDGDFDAVAPYRTSLPPDGPIKTSLTLPQSVGVGVAVRPSDRFEFETNAVWMGWSSVDKLVIDLPAGAQTISPRNYEDKVSIRIGGEYKLVPNKFDIRLGYMYDPTPIPTTALTATLPDINRHDLTAGFSYHMGPYDIDFGFLWVTPGERGTSDVPNTPQYKGTYELEVFLGNVSFSGRFGG